MDLKAEELLLTKPFEFYSFNYSLAQKTIDKIYQNNEIKNLKTKIQELKDHNEYLKYQFIHKTTL